MIKKMRLMILLFLLICSFSLGQSLESLRLEIESVLEGKSATVGVAIRGNNPEDKLSVNGNNHLPMQSVFKFHLALAVLHQVDQAKFSLDDKITIDKELIDRYSHLWSPLRKQYPDGANVSIAEILKYTIAVSDNLGCDLLFKLVGGTAVVETYLHQLGIEDIAIVHTEYVMQAKWELQYENWTTANATSQLLKIFYENEDDFLSINSYNFLLDILMGTTTGQKSIRGLLPENAIVAHKTGHSGKNELGLTGALNDIGIIFLPDGSYFYLSVLLSDSMEDSVTNQRIVAEIAKLAWDYFSQ